MFFTTKPVPDSLKALLLLLTLFTTFRVWAEPNVVGTFSGTLNGQRDACFTTPSPSSNAVTLTITSQSGGSFSGTFTVSGLTNGGNVSGTITNAGAMSGTFSGANILGGSFSGTFNGSQLTISPLNFSVEDLSMNCFDLGGTLNFTSSLSEDGVGIDPEVTPGTTLKDAGTIQTEVNTIQSPIHSHLKKTLHGTARGGKLDKTGFLIEGEGGLNAGDHQFDNVGLWLSYNYTATENDFFRTAFESDRHTAVGGIDISPNDRFVVGLAMAWETSDTDTTFNAGNLESDGFTLAPYVGVLLSDNWSLDASFGHSWFENDQFRTDPTTAARITSDPDSRRFFFSGNLNGISFIDHWIIGGRLGFLFARNKTEDFTESNGTAVAERVTRLGQIRLGGDVAYSYGNWEPYVSGMYEYDFNLEEIQLTAGPQPDNDRDDLYFSIGLRFYGDTGLTANFEYAKRLLREDFDEDSLTISVRYDY